MDLRELTQKLISIYGENLLSLILYGSAATGEYTKKYSDYNLIAVLKHLSPVELNRANKLIRKWVRKGNPPVLFFDEEHIKTSSDVFPIEFLDIIKNHKLLHGKDCFEGITIDRKNLRHECESELKGKLLKLHSEFLLNGHRKKRVKHLMLSSISSFAAVFKGVLYLIGEEPANTKKEIIEQLARFIDFNPTVFFEILSARAGDLTIRGKEEILEKFEQYLTAIRIIIRYVDKCVST